MSARTAAATTIALLAMLIVAGCGGGGGSQSVPSHDSAAADRTDVPEETPTAPAQNERSSAPDAKAKAPASGAKPPSRPRRAKNEAKDGGRPRNPVQAVLEEALKGPASGAKGVKGLRQGDPVAKLVEEARKAGVRVIQHPGGAGGGITGILRSLEGHEDR